jgi:hypothetical protein
MSSAGELDIRAPIGVLFTVLGVMIACYGLFGWRSAGAAGIVSDINVNLWWGLVMLVFGLVLLAMARRRMARSGQARGG